MTALSSSISPPRLLLDQGLPFRAAHLLSAAGIDTIHVRDVGLSAASDEDILAFALGNGRTCVTLDHDFHRILALTGASGPSVILIRGERLNHEAATDWISRIVATMLPHGFESVAATATRNAVRFRRLPFLRKADS